MSQLEDLLQECTVKLTIPGQMGWGTGFFVATGWILTCGHVVKQAGGQPVQVRWQQQENWAQAVVEKVLPEPYDVALLRVTLPMGASLPCVYLDEGVDSRDPLYLFGYPDEGDRQGEPRTFYCDGRTGGEIPAILFKLGQVRPGMSGSPLLNQRTRKVCGMVKFTRDRSFDLGGGAIPTGVILEQLPELRELQREFHGSDRRWTNLITQPGIDFQPYLRSLTTTYEKWWQLYTLTDAEGKQRQKQESAPMFDFGLMVQTVTKQEPQQERTQEQEKVERFSVLDGLRKYALGKKPETVLLVGRPGSGKSTALARLMLEEANSQTSFQTSEVFKTSEVSAQIPILVELRYWQGSIAQLILNALKRHDLAVASDQLETVVEKSLLLFDGVNELPSEEARTQLFAFRRDHPNVPMIFTTRDLSLGGDLGIDRKLEMQPLTETQMQAFVRAYVPEQAEAMLGQLKDRLREFGQTPLLLWMLCSLFQQTQTIPQNLGEVFRAFTQGYERQLKQDVVVESDRRLWPELLKVLAARMMQGEKSTEFRVAIAPNEIYQVFADYLQTPDPLAPRKALDDLLKHHLLQRNGELVEFRHQLIQEYYAAEWLLVRVAGLDAPTLQREYLNYLKWTEPMALMLALENSEAHAAWVVQQALDVDWRLGARLAGEVKQEFQAKTVKFVEVLVSPDWLKLKCLEATRSECSIPGLLKLVEDSDYGVQWSAAKVLGTIGTDAAIDGLLKLLEHFNSDARRSAAYGLGEIGTEAAIPGLLKLIDDWEVHRTAASALGEIGTEAAIPKLLKLLEDDRWHMRNSAAYALGKIGSEAAIDGLLKLLEDSDSGVRGSAAEALGEIDSEAVIDGLLKYLESSRPDVRGSAAKALGEIGTEVAIDELLKLLEDSDSDVRGSAAEALGKIGSEVAIDGLLKLLGDSDYFSNVCWIAAKALGKIGSEVAIPMLLKLVEDADGIMVRFHAASALSQIGTAVAIDGLLKLLEHSDADVRSSAASALGELGTAMAIDRLLKLLEDADADVRWRAASALGKLGAEAAIDGLLKLLEDADSKVRGSAAEALGKIGSEAAIPKLLKLLEDANWGMRTSAAKALGEIGTEGAIPMLFKWLEDSDYSTRSSASSALGNIAKIHPEASAYRLPQLLTLILTDAGQHAHFVILDIQANCKYYNYSIKNKKLEVENEDQRAGVSEKTPHIFPNVTEVKIFEKVARYYETPPPPPDPPS